MKRILKNIFLTLCFTVYCLSVFSSVAVPSFETNLSEQHTEEVYLTELSKILFPQVVSAEGYGINVIPASPNFEGGIDQAYVATQFLSKLTVENGVKIFKESKAFTLQFRSEDIIFPFHNFW